MSSYGQQTNPPRPPVRIGTLNKWKHEGQRWAMLTAYDYSTAAAFTAADIPVLLVGDSAANVVYGYDTTTAVSMEEMIPLARAVRKGAPSAFVIADLPFGTYEASDEQAVMNATRMIRETGADCVKIEGGVRMAKRIRALTDAGLVVVAHIGFTPQSVSGLSGFKVQGRGDGADQLRADAQAVVEAGAQMVVMEMVPASLAADITATIPVPTCGIGAGAGCDGQVLVWHDMVDLPHGGRRAKFVRQFGHIGEDLTQAARDYRQAVEAGEFPAEEHSFE